MATTEPQAEQGIEDLRQEALKAAAQVMFPNIQQIAIEGGIGAPEYTERRYVALSVIRQWLQTEFAWFEQEAMRDQPWEVRYASASDREGVVRKVLPSEDEARKEARRSDATASFGYYIVKQARRPLEP